MLSAISGTQWGLPAQLPTANTVDSAVVQQVDAKKSAKDVTNETEQYVRDYFQDVPIMIHIAECESHFKQFESDGSVHRGTIDNRDIGVMQINEHYQGASANKANLNIYTLEGNTAFAKMLYKDQGTHPWNSSRGCWGKYQTSSDTLAMASK